MDFGKAMAIRIVLSAALLVARLFEVRDGDAERS
jgi:hypothetical protein